MPQGEPRQGDKTMLIGNDIAIQPADFKSEAVRASAGTRAVPRPTVFPMAASPAGRFHTPAAAAAVHPSPPPPGGSCP